MASIGDLLVKTGLMVNAGQATPVGSGQTQTVNGEVGTPIVITQASTSDQFEAFTVPVGPATTMLLNADPGRNKATIRNTGTQNVYIGRAGVVGAGGGFMLVPAASISVETTAAIAATSPTSQVTAPTNVAVWAERDSGSS